jgi:hypothetical protein
MQYPRGSAAVRRRAPTCMKKSQRERKMPTPAAAQE